MCFTLFTVNNTHTIRNITKINNSESDSEDSPVQDSKDREIKMMSRKHRITIQQKVFKIRIKNLLIHKKN